MSKRRRPVLLLALCLILGACGQAQQSQPPQNDSQDSVPESFKLPQCAGVDWNDVPQDGTGEGGEAPEKTGFPPYTYVVSEYYELSGWRYSTVPDENGVVLSVSPVKITGLRNQILQNRINDLIEEQVQELSSAKPAADAAELGEMAAANGADKAYVGRQVRVSTQVSGRVLSLCFTRVDSLQLFDERDISISSDALQPLEQERRQYMFDMYDGRQLKLRDLFFDEAPYAQVIDAAIVGQMEKLKASGLLKRAFCGLPEDYPYVSAEGGSISIWFPQDNPYTASEQTFSVGPEVLHAMCGMLYEDPSAFLDEKVQVERFALQRSVSVSAHVFEPAAGSGADVLYSPRLSGGAPQPVLVAVNTELAAMEARYAALDYLPQEMQQMWENRTAGSVYVSYHALGSYFCVQYVTVVSAEQGRATYCEYATFDLRNGRRLSAADLLVPSEQLTQFLEENGIVQPLEQLTNVMVGYGFDVIVPPQSVFDGNVYIPAAYFDFSALEGGGAQ